MIDVENVWTPQILWYCRLISEPAELERAFNQRTGELWTSVDSYDELLCQIFDDLDAINMLEDLDKSTVPESLKSAIKFFISELDSFNNKTGNATPNLKSDDWDAVTSAARSVLAASGDWKDASA